MQVFLPYLATSLQVIETLGLMAIANHKRYIKCSVKTEANKIVSQYIWEDIIPELINAKQKCLLISNYDNSIILVDRIVGEPRQVTLADFGVEE